MSQYFIIPYQSACDIKFGITSDELRQLVGTPWSKKKNYFQEEVYYYEHFSVSLSVVEQLVVEVSFTETCDVWVEGIEVFGDPLAFEKLAKLDANPLQGLGCIVFLKLGIASTGLFGEDGDRTVTGFAKGKWDGLIARMKPFPVRRVGSL